MQSKKPSKQRKHMLNAPLHQRGKLLRTSLSEELSKKYQKSSARVIKGDKVKVVKGQHAGKSGMVERVDTKNLKIYVSEINYQKPDGTKIPYKISQNSVTIIELNLNDKKRQEILKRK